MTKFAVGLVSLEPSHSPEATAEKSASSASRGLLAALIYDSLGDLLSQINDGFEPVQLSRAATAQEAVEHTAAADTALLVAEIAKLDDAFQVLLALKLLKEPIASGRVRVIISCAVPSKTLHKKIRANGCTELVTGTENPDHIVQKARILIELLLFRRSVARLPGGRISSIGLAFLLSEWVSQNGIDYPSLAHLYCSCVSAACGGARVELFAGGEGDWRCAATSDGAPSRWLDVLSAPEGGVGELRVEWIGDRAGAIICSAAGELTSEQSRLLQAAADLSRDFLLKAQPTSVLKRSGLKN